MSDESTVKRARFHSFAWAYLAYLIFVILFGAFVRISGSGDGCGANWPDCHGEMWMLPDNVKTGIEYTHRQTSGLALPLALVLLVLGFKRFPKGHLVRVGMIASIAFLLVEALIGARLVLLELVGMNDSWPRAYWMAAHLTSTYILTAATAVVVFASSPEQAAPPDAGARRPGLLVAGLVTLYVIGATGAITALGDTLYPVEQLNALDATLREKLEADQAGSAHFLRRMRMVHPIVAVLGGSFVAWLGLNLPKRSGVEADHPAARWGMRLAIITFAQLCVGVTNIWLGAPGWMQVIHLAFACAVWLCLCWVGFELWLGHRR